MQSLGMYWSRAFVTPRSDRYHGVEYRVHQLVSDLFEQYTGVEQRPYLWRLRTSPPNIARLDEAEVLILSSRPPAIGSGREHLETPAGRLERLQTRPYPALPLAGTTVDFDITVNATMRLQDSRQRLDVYDAAIARLHKGVVETPPASEDVYRTWLGRQLAGAATIDSDGCVVASRQRRTVLGPERHAVRHGRTIAGVLTTLHGTLTIQDPRALEAVMLRGVGHQRALGCGLLCLLPQGTWTRQDSART